MPGRSKKHQSERPSELRRSKRTKSKAASESEPKESTSSSSAKASSKTKRKNKSTKSTDDQKTLTQRLVDYSKHYTGGTNSIYPSPGLSPFQNLVAALLLSNPINHQLVVRSLDVVFGKEYDLNTPQKVINAGEEKIWDALHTAHTLHKEKSAALMVGMAQKIIEDGGDGNDAGLSVLRKQVQKDGKEAITAFKGLGPTGADIFLREVQLHWEELYPVADERALAAAKIVGLPHTDAKALADRVQQDADAKDERETFVRVLDALVLMQVENTIEAFAEGYNVPRKELPKHQD